MITSWHQFESSVRRNGRPLLCELDRFPDAVLVAGCQRSGTTAVARLIREAGSMADFSFTPDDELDAALILSGYLDYSTGARACFQTTYLNERYVEYFDHDNYRLIWLLRRPEDVVCSMLRNWKRGALNRLFRGCGHEMLDTPARVRYRRWGNLAFSRLTKACLSYNAKTAQVHELARGLPPERLFIADYSDLVLNRETRIPEMFAFAGISFEPCQLDGLHERSLGKSQQMKAHLRREILAACEPEYERARALMVSR